MTVWGVIPARAGSKGIPGKNKRLVGGKALIRYTFDEAVRSTKLDRLYLSTDDQDILAIARDYPSIVVPGPRPPHLATATAKTIDVVLHLLDLAESGGETPPAFVTLLQPTAPLRTAAHIDDAITRLLASQATHDSLASVAALQEPHPHKVKRIEGGRLVPFIDGADSERPRQQLPPAFRLNGAIYITATGTLRERRSFFGETLPFVMDERDSINVDTPEDLELLELRLRQRGR